MTRDDSGGVGDRCATSVANRRARPRAARASFVRALAMASITAFTLTSSACSADQRPSADPVANTSATAAPTTASPAPTPPAQKTSKRTLSRADSPVAKFLGWTGGDHEFTSDELDTDRQRHEEFQNALATCMKEQGFTYEPEPWHPPVGETSDDYVDLSMDDRAALARDGFGIVDAGLAASNREFSPQELADLDNSAAEQEAYAIARFGSRYARNEEEADAIELTPYDWRTAGCEGSVTHELYPDGTEQAQREAATVSPLAEFDDLELAMIDLPTQVNASAEQRALDEKWSECMSRSGFNYPTLRAAQTAIGEELDALAKPHPEVQNMVVYDAGSPEFRAVAEKEVQVAVAAFDCREELDYSDTHARILISYEERFIAEHRAEMEAYRDALDLLAVSE